MKNQNKAVKDREKFVEELVAQVQEDFKIRREERLPYERQWELNLNFLMGKQHVSVDGRGELYDDEKAYFWQEKETFNHIAPVVESRLAKFSRVVPVLSVKPLSDDDQDAKSARNSEKLISSVFEEIRLPKTVLEATSWSEACGTAFYKISWNNDAGSKVGEIDGKPVFEGGVEITPVSPFEIYPDSLTAQNLCDCFSIIHAKSMSVDAIKRFYGVTVLPEKVEGFTITPSGKIRNNDKKSKGDSAVVIEKYERPSEEFPDGRLIVVCGDKLLYYGELPHVNGENGTRTFPFVKQESIVRVGSFFGGSIVERLIPVQRAFNAVKNRKHEFINRLTTGVMTVEDGSVDVDELSLDGLSPGKILVYRQGAKAPEMMDSVAIPESFTDEEEKLLNEFVIIGGVSDMNTVPYGASATSGTALQLLMEQDNERMTVPAEIIRNAYVEIAKHVLRLYSQHAKGVKAVKIKSDAGILETVFVDLTQALCDDVYLESENELSSTPSQKREMIFKLYESGILKNSDGEISDGVKEKVLSLLGYKDLDYKLSVTRLHENKAREENAKIKKEAIMPDEIDDHDVHLAEHARCFLSEYQNLSEKEKANINAHYKAHKELKNNSKIRED